MRLFWVLDLGLPDNEFVSASQRSQSPEPMSDEAHEHTFV